MSKTMEIESALGLGRRVLSLLEAYGGRLTGRIPADATSAVMHRIRVLEASAYGVGQAQLDAKGATLDERATSEQIASVVMSIRAQVRSSGRLDAGAQKRWGVGEPMRPGVTRAVVTAAETVVREGSALSESDLAALGLRARDLRSLEVMAAALASRDEAQRTQKGAAKSMVSGRESAIREMVRLAHSIGNAGAVEFSPIGSDPEAGEPALPEVEALFRQLAADAVLPSSRLRAAKAAKKTAAQRKAAKKSDGPAS